MKNRIILVVGALLLCTSVFFGCGKAKTSMAYTFKVETGDSIELKLDTSDGYSITSELPFTVSKDGKTLTQGTFITKSGYKQYVDAAKNDAGAKIIEESSNNNVEYLMWNYNDSEYNYVIFVKGSNTGVILGNNISDESAKDVFKRLTVTLK